MGSQIPAISAEHLALSANTHAFEIQHSLFDVDSCVVKKALHIAEGMLQGCLFEVCTESKPGLVTPSSMGSHQDMNIFTFMQSSSTLFPCFYLSAMTGLSHSGELTSLLSKIRKFGVSFESRLLSSTDQVNTQRGILFLASVCAAATAYLSQNEGIITCTTITQTMSHIVKGICKQELEDVKKPDEDKSISEYLYSKYGITGIRGEVEQGLPSITLHGYPTLVKALSNKELSLNEALLHTLLVIISVAEDSNIIWRGSPDKLKTLKVLAIKTIENGGFLTSTGKRKYKELCDYCIKYNLSPGGAADLLAVTVSIYILVNGRINTIEV